MATPDIEYDIDLNTKKFDAARKAIDASFSKATKGVVGFAAGFVALSKGIDLTVQSTQKLVMETGQLETATVKWDQLLGSADAADKKIKQVFNFSNRTPFTFKGVNEAAQTLYNLSNGALDSTEDLTRLGDASAKGGRPIEELAVTYGRLFQKFEQGDKAFAEEINRLNELGIITGDTKKQIQDMDSTLLQAKGWETLEKGMAKAEGTMEKLSVTIEGKLSTLEGVWDGVFAFEDKEVQENIKSSIDTMINTLNENKPAIQQIISEIFSASSNFVNDWVKGAIQIYDIFSGTKGSRQNAALDKLRSQSIETQLTGKSKSEIEKFYNTQKLLLNEQSKTIEEIKSTAIGERVKVGFDGTITGKESLKELIDLRESIVGDGLFSEGVAKLDVLIEETSKQKNLEIAIDASNKILGEIYKVTKIDSESNNNNNSNDKNPQKFSGLDYYFMEQLRVGFDSQLQPTLGNTLFGEGSMKMDSLSTDAFFESTGKSLQSGRKDLQDVNKMVMEFNKEELEAQKQHYAGIESVISSSEQSIISIHEAFAKNSIATFTRGMQGLSSSVQGILQGLSTAGVGGLGGLIPGAGIAGAAFGLISTISSLIEGDDTPDSNIASGYETASSRSRANIVSSGPENIYQSNYFNLDGCIVDEATFTELVNERIAPKLAEASAGVLP